MSTNQHGLNRNIPDGIKRIVRQRCGFGCVVCGSAIFQYEHFDPPFADATAHRAEGITLLCGSCHDRKTRGYLSAEAVIRHNNSPQSLTAGFSWGALDVGTRHPTIVLGTFTAVDTSVILQVLNDPILKIEEPSVSGEPFLVTAILKDRDENVMIEIDKNEWKTLNENWDCEFEGGRITIRSGLGNIELELISEPPNRIIIERLRMNHGGNIITCQPNQNLRLETPEGISFEAHALNGVGCRIGIHFDGAGIVVGVGCQRSTFTGVAGISMTK